MLQSYDADQRLNEGGAKRAQFPGRRLMLGCRKALTMSQALSSTADLLSKELRFEHGSTKTSFLPLVASNLVTPLMQTYCRLTNCAGNSPETGFSYSFWRLAKSWVSYTFSILHSYFHCCLSMRGCHHAL